MGDTSRRVLEDVETLHRVDKVETVDVNDGVRVPLECEIPASEIQCPVADDMISCDSSLAFSRERKTVDQKGA